MCYTEFAKTPVNTRRSEPCRIVTQSLTKSFFKRHEFETLARKHHVGQQFRSFSRWSQFTAMLVGQLTGRKSLRDLVDNLKVQGHKLYHLGMKEAPRSTLARVNEEQPHQLYKALFHKLLGRCQAIAPKNRFKLDAKLYLLDATIINLCLKVFVGQLPKDQGSNQAARRSFS